MTVLGGETPGSNIAATNWLVGSWRRWRGRNGDDWPETDQVRALGAALVELDLPIFLGHRSKSTSSFRQFVWPGGGRGGRGQAIGGNDEGLGKIGEELTEFRALAQRRRHFCILLRSGPGSKSKSGRSTSRVFYAGRSRREKAVSRRPRQTTWDDQQRAAGVAGFAVTAAGSLLSGFAAREETNEEAQVQYERKNDFIL